MLYNWRKYKYNPQSYAGVLNKIHNYVEQDMKNHTLKNEAYELQTILQDIKKVASMMRREPIHAADLDLYNQYKDFILEIGAIQTAARTESQVSGKPGIRKTELESALFRRDNKTKTIQGTDNIFEEDFAALIAALEKRLTGSTNIQQFLGGTKTADVSGEFTKELQQQVAEVLEDTANQMGVELNSKNLTVKKAQKIDTYGLPQEIVLEITMNTPPLERLAYYLQNATFTDKQYSTWTNQGYTKRYSQLSLHLGNTILYKPVVGVVSEVYKDVNVQRMIFFRGMTILGYPNSNHSATTEEVAIHFNHMRFIYELRGTGLYDDYGNAAIAKYLIYNDPNSDNIFVRDTASIILEYLGKQSTNIFGGITLAASQAKSSK